MRKQNRNNRICTNEESGKTDFIIDPLLPIGKENAITTQELMRISGCGSSRELRQRIALERERGAIICSGSGRGYWKPKNRQEIQEFIKTMDARAWNEDLIMILQAAIQSNSGLASKLFITLTEGCGYDKICTFASVPARKTDYQAYLRKALKILNDMLLLKNMPTDFPAEKI